MKKLSVANKLFLYKRDLEGCKGLGVKCAQWPSCGPKNKCVCNPNFLENRVSTEILNEEYLFGASYRCTLTPQVEGWIIGVKFCPWVHKDNMEWEHIP